MKFVHGNETENISIYQTELRLRTDWQIGVCLVCLNDVCVCICLAFKMSNMNWCFNWIVWIRKKGLLIMFSSKSYKFKWDMENSFDFVFVVAVAASVQRIWPEFDSMFAKREREREKKQKSKGKIMSIARGWNQSDPQRIANWIKTFQKLIWWIFVYSGRWCAFSITMILIIIIIITTLTELN